MSVALVYLSFFALGGQQPTLVRDPAVSLIGVLPHNFESGGKFHIGIGSERLDFAGRETPRHHADTL